MLKRISTEDAELGMFIHKLEGSWFKHPFWKSRFLLEDPGLLSDLRASDVDGVIIDVSKGRDVEQPRAACQAPPPAVTDRRSPARRPSPGSRSFGQAAWNNDETGSDRKNPLRSTAPLSMSREFGNAKRVEGQAHKFVLKIFLESRLGKAVKASTVEPVVDDIYASIQRNSHAFNGLLRCMNGAHDVYRHSVAVCALMVSLAKQMKLPPRETREAGMAGLLMDIGAGKLLAGHPEAGGDYQVLPPEIRGQHVMLSHDMLTGAGDMPETILPVALRHHERMDGSGYPQGLKAADIDLFSRMAAVCDYYDYLVAWNTNDRILDPAQAIRRLSELGEAFDQDIVNHLIDCLGVYPIGSFVELRSGRLAMVVNEDLADRMLPTVRTFYSLAERKPIKQSNIDLGYCYGEDEIVGTADFDGLGLPDVADLRERIFAAAIGDKQ